MKFSVLDKKINVESLARRLGMHIAEHFVKFTTDEQYLRYLLSGLRLLHTLYDIASHHSKLEQVLVQDKNVGTDMIHSITSMIIVLSCFGEKINFSNQSVLLYSTLLASGLYLLKAIISSETPTFTLVLLALDEVDSFTIAAFTAVRVVVDFLQAKLPAQHIDPHMKSKLNEVYYLFHLCESSLQFLQSLCQQMLIREHFVKNKKLCGEGVVLRLVQNIMKLPKYEDPHLMDEVYRLKSKVLSIMLHLCEVESPSFLDMASSTTQSLDLAKSTVFEVDFQNS
ncbi:hypothetical protein L1987_82950 [Smallanthus sonchifolius]|uniref:Uncharacterized protein n=1 Tax=Smallanthus sonchifolius TaxID=185202 RepID=A0ACB8YAQ7_9ASTR|nr:hypothetical protein L1987_82950 [Smallanthus sonchifolius]